MLPEIQDDHLFDLETAVRNKVKQRNLCLDALMSQCQKSCDKCNGAQVKPNQMEVEEDKVEVKVDNDMVKRNNFAFASAVSKNKLRCVKM